MAQHLSLSNGQMTCPNCNSTFVIYGSAAGKAEQRLYAAECSNKSCLMLLRFYVQVQSIMRPARQIIKSNIREDNQ